MNVANGFFVPLLRLRGIPVVVNVDGLEWKRAKWNKFARAVFLLGALFTASSASGLIADSRAIQEYWRKHFKRRSTFAAYGAEPAPESQMPDTRKARPYVLMVARLVPENSVEEFLGAARSLSSKCDVVIVGSSGYGGELEDRVRQLAEDVSSVHWTGHISDDKQLYAYWQHAAVYFHGHTVGGTNPALVQAMALGAPIVAVDTIYNRETLGPAGVLVTRDSSAIHDAISKLFDDGPARAQLSRLAKQEAAERYTWEIVCNSYEDALRRWVTS